MAGAKEIISAISDGFFLSEPLLFNILCSHSVRENRELSCPFRSGKGRIEYSPALVEQAGRDKAERLLATELCRIILRHPYGRVPENPDRPALKKASDVTIQEHVFVVDRWEFLASTVLPQAGQLGLKPGLSFEEYYRSLKSHSQSQCYADSGGQAGSARDAEATGLWGEDEEMSQTIGKIVRKATESGQWGSLPGHLIERIYAEKSVRMDFRRILRKFRTRVSGNVRVLTRMRPSRRYGFDNMGSRYGDAVSLLVAVDSSGSIAHDDLENFFSVINCFFKFNVTRIKVIVFDTQVAQELDFKKARKCLDVKGRGGTDFQPAVDYFESHADYDGMIVFTDGDAPAPKVSRPDRILWVFSDKHCYDCCCKDGTFCGSSAAWIPAG